ncbi:aspartate ammonia-lyase [Candidatus Bipolaricaulota bacterium]|nr:aspartate ammonia-lyase [Candidatus Bipolaricaulota bacterium]
MSRTERDSLGQLELPDEAYYGIQTQRAIVNFPVSGLRADPLLVRAYVHVKRAAAVVNCDLKALDDVRAGAIIRAADDVLGGALLDQFVVDVYQAGAGTSFNMNVNEVLANRALEVLGHPRGDYGTLSPNDHVNLAQSTNDTFPTAAHLAAMEGSIRLIAIVEALASAIEERAASFAEIPKSGRTHLMDAVPLTLGAEVGAWSSALRRAARRLDQRRDDLRELPIGGTAVGSGANAGEGYRAGMIHRLSDAYGESLRAACDSYEALQSRAQLAGLSGALRELALELTRIANDLRLLASGPVTGFAELRLPAVQPGSSIMPGKVNPVMAECLNMVAYQVIGNDTTVAMAAQAGQLELNVMTPVMIHNLLSSIDLLTRYLPVFQDRCIAGMSADEQACRGRLEDNPAIATLLAPRIGYLQAAEIAREAVACGRSVLEIVLEKKLLEETEARTLLDPMRVARGIYPRDDACRFPAD